MAPPKKSSAPAEEDLPEVYSLALHKVRAGAWVVLGIKTQGSRVLDSEVLSNGAISKAEADNVLRVAVTREFLLRE